MTDSKFLLEGSLTDRALVLCLVTSFAWRNRAMLPQLVTAGSPALELLPIQNQVVLVRPQ
jgi:hypothetical protein